MVIVATEKPGVVTFTFTRPNRRNAMLAQMWSSLPALIQQAQESPSTRILVFQGANGQFGAGNDIWELPAACRDADMALEYGRAMASAMASIENCRLPTIAAIEGDCYGASVALALACDLRVASDDAHFAITPAKLGAMYLRSDLVRLWKTVGKERSLDLIFTGRRLDAIEACAIGLVGRIFSKVDFQHSLSEITQTILNGSSQTIEATKAVVSEIDGFTSTKEDEGTLSIFVRATQGDHFKEGISAFQARRNPVFS